MTRSFDAILFDMDGLMINSEAAAIECWRMACADLGVACDEAFLLGMVGLATARCTDYVAAHLGGDVARADALRERCNSYYMQTLEQGRIGLMPGIVQLLDWVVGQGIVRAVATSTKRAQAEIKLDKSGLAPYFSTVVAGDEVAATKPAPDLFLGAAGRLGIDPARCLVLEDSAYGVMAGHAAGMRVIMVPDLIAPSAEQAALAFRICDDLHQALEMIRQL
ncbi:HAD family hydrolase [Paludibacterium yongneupense]|uniref:HAD family hydrolase n=1 Tax=Paludibacterium yongneupense TaxID=400061 RepID=UPI00040E845B|nr:HAD family phosphatase [Paludibacterium yongneupense]